MFAFIHTLSLIPLVGVVIGALYVLLTGADYFVRGAASVSRRIGMSTFVVGLTVVAIGTSAPELFVNIIAAYTGATALSIGNILGSNTADILLGLGLAAIVTPLTIKSQTVWKEIPYSLLGAVIICVFGSDILIDGVGSNVITRSEGIALLGFFVIFLVYTFGLNKAQNGVEKAEVEVYDWGRSALYILGGLVGLVLGGKLVVDAAVAIAQLAGISENLIGLTIVAAGTSLPEIATALIAVRRGHIDMVVGGIVGTIIFNIFFALGVTALFAPLPFHADNLTDAFFLMCISLLLFFFMFIGRRQALERWQGVAFILLYIGYIAFAVLRG